MNIPADRAQTLKDWLYSADYRRKAAAVEAARKLRKPTT